MAAAEVAAMMAMVVVEMAVAVLASAHSWGSARTAPVAPLCPRRVYSYPSTSRTQVDCTAGSTSGRIEHSPAHHLRMRRQRARCLRDGTFPHRCPHCCKTETLERSPSRCHSGRRRRHRRCWRCRFGWRLGRRTTTQKRRGSCPEAIHLSCTPTTHQLRRRAPRKE